MYIDNRKNKGSTKHLNLDQQKKSKPKSVIKAGDYKITINDHNYDINPFELLQQLYKLGHSDYLSKEEKEEKLKDIFKDYMG